MKNGSDKMRDKPGVKAGPNTAPKGVGVKGHGGGLKSPSVRAALFYARKRRIARQSP